MSNDKTNLLAALACQVVAVQVEGFGELRLRQLTVEQTDAARARASAKDAAPSDFGLYLLLVAATDTAGAPLFDDADIPALRAASGTKVNKLVERVLQVNGYAAGEEGSEAGNAAAATNGASATV